ncbi:septal ring lytic transglycosylase RlpA family protein [Methylobacillus gramineus]|uniref:septal ring lytic transglycosylase RlpA family protein n=1 Tax=Methylobacillus gramineus TaxID=755169 RepID=UPI001CFF9ECA|nr:septal ring lytic transglycosylase RlpA family protein [Methylobacillus gramineus]MCB5185972.1 septal ring lytic transglycosylase RlpA family protein [Methylobacillus gramineus]
MNSARYVLPAILSVLLVACGGGTAVKPETGKAQPPSTQKAPSKKGGYYLDDGPGDNPPGDIDNIPDAVPRAETPLPRANRPYSALGHRYTPMTEHSPYKQRGVASWYGKRYHGQKTSSGEIYDMYGMTGAHTILPLPSYVRVTNPENGRSVVVRINDRGPFHDDRLIDLSYAAAYKLRLIEKGSGIVDVEALDANGKVIPLPQSAPPAQQSAKPLPAPPAERNAPTSTNAMNEPAVNQAVSGDYVQVGAFSLKANGDRLVETLQQQKLADNVQVENWYNAGTYRVRLGPYSSRQQAEAAAAKIKQALNTNAIVIRQ